MAKNLNASERSSVTIIEEKEIKTQTYLESESSLITNQCTNGAPLDKHISDSPKLTASPLNVMTLDDKAAPSAATAGGKSSTGESLVMSGSGGGSSKTIPKLATTQTQSEGYDLKCLLLADATLDCAPLHLRQLLQHFNESALPTQPELLLLLIYCVALESGFVTQCEYAICSDKIARLPSNASFHSKNLMHVTRFPTTYESSDSKTHFTMQLHNLVRTLRNEMPGLLNALLTCLVTGDFLIVTLTPWRCRNIPGRSLCLSIARYVLSSQPKGKPLYQRFRKTGELSMLLRQNLFLPVRNQQLDALEIGIYPGLLGLPEEMYEAIFDYLSQNQLKILANVCKPLNYYTTHSKYFEK